MKKKLPPILDAVEFRRDQYGWSQARMGTELGIGQSHYSEFLNGKRTLSLNARIRAYKLGVPAEVLLQSL